jgi:hypothetical protein
MRVGFTQVPFNRMRKFSELEARFLQTLREL